MATTTSTYAQEFADRMNVKFPVVNSWDENYGTTAGPKFDRITRVRDGRSVSVHAFVERATGKLVKAAGWKAPAKRADGTLQSQFDLSTPEGMDAAVEAADRHGAYLYIARIV